MLSIVFGIISAILMAFSIGVIAWFFVSTAKALTKFDNLDTSVKKKLVLIKNYMVFIRKFKMDEIKIIGELSDDEIESLNKISDVDERMKTAMEYIRRIKR